MTDDIVEEDSSPEAAQEAPVTEEHNNPPVDDTEGTVWAPEPSAGGDDIIAESVEEWMKSVNFESTEDVPIPDRLVDQVIGQEAGSIVIKKAAEQRRHMLMIGDPGTGKSMLARSMTDLLPKDALEDLLVYPNEDDENEPRVRSVPAGRGDRIVKLQKESMRTQRERSQKMLLIAFAAVGFLLLIATLQSGDIITLLFGGFLLMFGYMFIRGRLSSGVKVELQRSWSSMKVLRYHRLSMQLRHFLDPCLAMCVTTRSNLVAWKHQPTTELNRERFTELTRVCFTSTK